MDKPTFNQVYATHATQLSMVTLSDESGQSLATIDRMVRNLRVSQDEASKVLSALSSLTGQTYTLENVGVRLLHTGQSEETIMSEVAHIKQQIESEYASAKQGLQGLTQGTSRHPFMTKRAENMALHFDELVDLVGVQEATNIYDQIGKEQWSNGER